MRLLVTACSAVLFASSFAARGDDTKPPAIDRVRAAERDSQVVVEARIVDETGVLSATVHHRSKGGGWQAAPMTKNELDEGFKASFPGGPETEYWIEAIDLLGNGPASYGAEGKPLAVGSSRRAHAVEKRKPATAKLPPRPLIEHRKPADPVEGQDFSIRATIRSSSPIALSGVYYRKAGEAGYSGVVSLRHVGGDEYEARIPAEKARGKLEYLIAAKDSRNQQTNQGDGNGSTWFSVSFKPAPRVPQPYAFAVNPPVRVGPGQPMTVRAQITAPAASDDAIDVPARAQVLWRGADGQERHAEMEQDPTGGLGGFKSVLPAQAGGALYYQIVACDASGAKCAVDTGGRRRWHGVAVSFKGVRPPPLDVPSKAPSSLPE